MRLFVSELSPSDTNALPLPLQIISRQHPAKYVCRQTLERLSSCHI
nr:MAG TPA: hypothetical protein [Caudoviricetes sp.]